MTLPGNGLQYCWYTCTQLPALLQLSRLKGWEKKIEWPVFDEKGVWVPWSSLSRCSRAKYTMREKPGTSPAHASPIVLHASLANHIELYQRLFSPPLTLKASPISRGKWRKLRVYQLLSQLSSWSWVDRSFSPWKADVNVTRASTASPWERKRREKRKKKSPSFSEAKADFRSSRRRTASSLSAYQSPPDMPSV